MSRNVKVYCRFRPQNAMEKERNGKNSFDVIDNHSVRLKSGSRDDSIAGPFSFDRVFGASATQEEVYNHVAKDLVKQCLDGYCCTCFAYGQTGAGKTHSMMGSRVDEAYAGIIPRMVADIFNYIGTADTNEEFTVKLSYVEVYLERIRDLLAPLSEHDAGGKKSRDDCRRFDSSNLKVRHDKKGRGLFIEGVSEFYLSNAEEMIRLLMRGDNGRATAATNMNAVSSRSHSISIVTISRKNTITGVCKTGKLFVCDLAGSEMVKKTAAVGTTLREAQQINKSLSALGNVIKALTEGSAHVPYRDSVLTRLLSEALGGNSKTSLLVVRKHLA